MRQSLQVFFDFFISWLATQGQPISPAGGSSGVN